jgi:MFS transporter, BCD family, chlorophyll transporter
MRLLTRELVAQWSRLGPRFLPFADAASADLPLSRLLRLSLFQVSVGMAMALLVGTLNRVMIVELRVPAALVAIMVAMPVLYAPFRTLIGFRSDTHRSALGWRRVPFIWMGTLIQFGGLAVMPFALLVLAGGGHAREWPLWVGQLGAGLCFLAVGAGIHTSQTAGLALATDLAAPQSRPKVVGLMYVSLLAGTIASAMAYGVFLSDFSPGRLIQVIQATGLATIVLNCVAMWKQETRNARRAHQPMEELSFGQAWSLYAAGPGARRRLAAIGLGTMGFAMQDVLLEPYGGQILGMSVGATTWLTAALAAGGLVGFSHASRVLGRGADPQRMSALGALAGGAAFAAVILAAWLDSGSLFAAGVILIGFGGGLFGHGTLTLTMNQAPAQQTGLALGAWGAVQATAAGVAVALGGLLRDGIGALAEAGMFGGGLAQPVTGYASVYVLEIVLLALAVWALRPQVLSGLRSLENPGAAGLGRTAAYRHD